MLDFSEKIQQRTSFPEYIEALERERAKVEVFQRELPLCLELITQAIEACKQQLSGTTTEYNLHGQPECSEQTSTEGPVFEEFIPIKKRAASDFRDGEDAEDDDDDDNDKTHSHKSKISKDDDSIDKKKSDWLSSVQLWNPDPPLEEDVTREETVMEVKKNGGAFQPFQKEKIVGKSNASTSKAATSSVPMPSTSSTEERARQEDHARNSKKEDKDAQRKQRRCWSPELHKRFLHAVQQLGGSDIATPKQIRELMKVDGLTNDEVKSHLQKYRLHTRRPSPTIHNNANPQAPQFVLVGGIWVQPPEYAAMATTASGEVTSVTATNGIFAPVATHPPTVQHPHAPLAQKPKPRQTEQSDQQWSQSEERTSHSEGGVHLDSPANSSSSTR